MFTKIISKKFFLFLVGDRSYSPSGGLLFWLFQTTSSLAKLGTLEISVMTLKRLSTRSYVRTTAVKPGALGGISGKKRGLFTLDHFCRRQKIGKIQSLFSLQTSYFICFSTSLNNYCRASLMNSVSIPVCKVFHDSVQRYRASVDGEVTCSNFQMMVYIMEEDLSSFRSQRLKEGHRRPISSTWNSAFLFLLPFKVTLHPWSHANFSLNRVTFLSLLSQGRNV